jgi:hypothetical protein
MLETRFQNHTKQLVELCFFNSIHIKDINHKYADWLDEMIKIQPSSRERKECSESQSLSFSDSFALKLKSRWEMFDISIIKMIHILRLRYAKKKFWSCVRRLPKYNCVLQNWQVTSFSVKLNWLINFFSGYFRNGWTYTEVREGYHKYPQNNPIQRSPVLFGWHKSGVCNV